MKICPNCGAENEDNILNCILCEFEFDMDSEEYIANENSDEISETFQEENYNSVSENDNALINNENDTPSAVSYDEDVIDKAENSKPGNKIIPIIIVLTVIAAIIGGVIWYLTKNKNDTPDNDSIIAESTTEAASTETPTEKVTEEKVTEETKTEVPTEEKIESPVDIPEAEIIIRDISYDEESIYNAYLDIVNGMDFTIPMRGFLTDMNEDGINELILPENGQYTIYYYSDGNIKAYSFGSYMALDNFVMYKVIGNNSNTYLYYRDNYSYKSLQGYFSLDTENQLNIFIDYPYENEIYYADWKITYNSSDEFANGYEAVDTFYAQPNDCHSALLDSFSHYNLDISDNSDYSKIDGLYYDELTDNLKVNDVQNTISDYERGKMYNLYHFKVMCMPHEGFLEDLTGDGIEELVIWGYGAEYVVYTYKNGDIEYTASFIDPLDMNTPLLSGTELLAVCRERAAEYGFSNSNFTVNSDIIGYVKTDGGDLNLRAEPNTASEIVTKIPYGTFINVYSGFWEETGWCSISVTLNGNTYYGYVSSDYIYAIDLTI